MLPPPGASAISVIVEFNLLPVLFWTGQWHRCCSSRRFEGVRGLFHEAIVREGRSASHFETLL
jgi:hypothetical protein